MIIHSRPLSKSTNLLPWLGKWSTQFSKAWAISLTSSSLAHVQYQLDNGEETVALEDVGKTPAVYQV